MPLLAEVSNDAGTAVLVVLGSLIGGAITWVYGAWKESRKTIRTNRVEDDKRNQDRADELYERAKADSEQARKNERAAQARAASLTNQIVEVKLLSVAKAEHIKYLEGLLADHEIPFRGWAPPTERPERSELETEAGE